MVATKSDFAREASSARASAAAQLLLAGADALGHGAQRAVERGDLVVAADRVGGRDRLAARVEAGVRADPFEPARQRAAHDERQQHRHRQADQRDHDQQRVGDAPDARQRGAAPHLAGAQLGVEGRGLGPEVVHHALGLGQRRRAAGRAAAGARTADVAVEQRQLAARERLHPLDPAAQVGLGPDRAAQDVKPVGQHPPGHVVRLGEARVGGQGEAARAGLGVEQALQHAVGGGAQGGGVAALRLDRLGPRVQARDDREDRQDQRERDDDERQQAHAQRHAAIPAGPARA